MLTTYVSVVVQKVPASVGLDVLQIRLVDLVSIRTIKHHGRVTIPGVGVTNKRALAMQPQVEELLTE